MDNLIVCVFKDREKAMDAWDQISELETLDDLVIFRETMLQKTERGDMKMISNVNPRSIRLVTLSSEIGCDCRFRRKVRAIIP